MGLLTFTRNQQTRRKLETGKLADSFSVWYLKGFSEWLSSFRYDFLHQNFAGTECCERLAYYGMSTNLINYLEKQMNMGSVTASTSVTNWQGTCYATPLIGAFIADAYLGRYWTIASFVIVYICVSLESRIDS